MTNERAELPIASVTAMIRAMDVSEAAIAMAERLKLNAEVRTCVGKWDERGSIAGWTKTANTRAKGPATVLVEVFVSDIAGEGREFDRYARQMQELIDENAALKAQVAALTPDAPLDREVIGYLIYRGDELDDNPFVPLHQMALSQADEAAGYRAVPVYVDPVTTPAPVSDGALREAPPIADRQSFDAGWQYGFCDGMSEGMPGYQPRRVKEMFEEFVAALSTSAPALEQGNQGRKAERLAFTFAFARGFQIADETSRSCLSALDDAWEEWLAASEQPAPVPQPPISDSSTDCIGGAGIELFGPSTPGEAK